MKLLGVILLVGGWIVAVAGLVVVDAVEARMIMALVGLGMAIAGLITLNKGHLEHAIWKGGIV
jgi:hypothetical protein